MAVFDFLKRITGFGPGRPNVIEGQKPIQSEGVQNVQSEGIASTQEEQPIEGMSNEEMLAKGFKPRSITIHYPDNPSELSHEEKKV